MEERLDIYGFASCSRVRCVSHLYIHRFTVLACRACPGEALRTTFCSVSECASVHLVASLSGKAACCKTDFSGSMPRGLRKEMAS